MEGRADEETAPFELVTKGVRALNERKTLLVVVRPKANPVLGLGRARQFSSALQCSAPKYEF